MMKYPRPKIVYLAGPITSREIEARVVFAHAEKLLSELGFVTVNPFNIQGYSIEGHINITWADCMLTDLQAIAKCDALFLLPGWQQSRGAQIEFLFARGLGLLVADGQFESLITPEYEPVFQPANELSFKLEHSSEYSIGLTPKIKP